MSTGDSGYLRHFRWAVGVDRGAASARRRLRPAHLLLLLAALSFIMVSEARATTPPTMDGLLDGEYVTYGDSYSFIGFVENASATLYVIDDPVIDPANMWLLWEVDSRYVDNSWDDDGANGQSQHPSWAPGYQHRFRDLAESDLQNIKLYNTCSSTTPVLWATMDLLDGFGGLEACGGIGGDGNGRLDIFNGLFDMNLDGSNPPDGADDGTFFGIPIIEGYLDLDEDGIVNPDTDLTANNYGGTDDNAAAGATIFGGAPTGSWQVIGGALDVDGDGSIETNGDDDYNYAGPTLSVDVGGSGYYVIDMNGNGTGGELTDDGYLSGLQIIDGQVDLNGGGIGTDDDGPFPPNMDFTVIDGFIEKLSDGPHLYPAACGPAYATPSGYSASMDASESIKTSINGGDWSKFDYTTSTVTNLNAYGYCHLPLDANGEGDCDDGGNDLIGNQYDATYPYQPESPSWKNSPGTDYVPVDAYSKWNYTIAYEMKIDRTVFTSGCTGGTIDALLTEPVELHASPNKIDTRPVKLVPLDDAAIGDYVWLDADRDGQQDAIEPGIANVTLRLYRDEDRNGIIDGNDTLVDTTITDANGGYLFDELFPGDYIVDVDETTLPAGLVATHGTGDTHGTIDLDANEEYRLADFGYAPTDDLGSIGNLVWLDANADGDRDAGEPGLAGVTVALYDANGDLVATTVTDADGNYLFSELILDDGVGGAGATYTVDVTDTAGVLAGLAKTLGTADTDDNSQMDPYSVTLSSSTKEILYADFGYAPSTAVIGDFVWIDADGEGDYDPGEPGVGGVTIELRDSTTAAVIATTTTADDGYYLFTGVAPGTYDVVVTDDDNVLDGYVNTYDGDAGAPDGDHEDVVVPSGTDYVYLDADFGYEPDTATVGTIGNQVWDDVDGDGVYEPGGDDGAAPGISGVTVELIQDSNGNGLWDTGELVIATDTTDSNGQYQFSGLSVDDGDGDADYVVHVSDTAGALSSHFSTTYSSTYAKTSGTIGSDNNSQPDPYAVELSASATSNQTADFGYDSTGTAYLGTIGDLVWLDANADGNRTGAGEADDEPGIASVTVWLYLDDGDTAGVVDANDTLVATEVTNSDGEYLFQGLAAGTYLVDVTDLNGALAGYAKTSGTANANGNSQSDPYSVTLTADGLGNVSSNLTADFGYTPNPATIGDFVWLDANQDGVQDDGEAGIGDVTVELRLTGTTTAAASTTTAADGSYLFTNVAPGTYDVVVTDDNGELTGYTQTWDPDVGTGTPKNNTDASITVAAGDAYLAADFGYYHTDRSGEIGNLVWIDDGTGGGTSGDGVVNGGELGVNGVSLDLVGPGPDGVLGSGDDEVLATTTTSTHATLGAGWYRFSGLPLDDGGGDGDADYLVVVTDTGNVLAGYGQTFGAADTDDNGQIDPYHVELDTGTSSVQHADFGFVPNGTAAIGDYVWIDADNDAIQDSSEPGVGGVTVRLLDSSDNLITTTTTAADGSYMFTGLPPGSYKVEIASSNFGTGAVLDSTYYSITSGSGGQSYLANTSPTITMGAGDVFVNADFGYVPTDAQDNSIGNYVWIDADMDAVQDAGEPGVAGVTVVLWSDPNDDGDPSDGAIIATTTTSDGATDVDGNGSADPKGTYLFTGLPDGSYVVEVTDTANALAGYFQTMDDDDPGAFDPTTGKTFTTPNMSKVQNLGVGDASSVSDLDQDFGYAPKLQEEQDDRKGMVGDFVWYDWDGDGVQDSNEAGIAGVTVNLYDDSGTYLGSNTTDANGFYFFPDLPVGARSNRTEDYKVTVDTSTLPSILTPTDTNMGGDNASETTSGDHTGASGGLYYRNAGENLLNDLTLDLGYAPANGDWSIGDYVWHDEDGDGTIDGTETGFEGVTLELTDSNGTVLQTTTTASDGSYLFDNLPNGDFVVIVTDTANVLSGYQSTHNNTTGGTDAKESPYSVTISNADIDYADFGYVKIDDGVVETTPVTLSYLASATTPGGVRIEWSTESEVGNIGFYLYAKTDGGLVRLNDVPVWSNAIDSTERQDYSYEVADIAAESFVIEDVDVLGRETRHGGFLVGETYGERVALEPIDWPAIHAEHEAKAEIRLAQDIADLALGLAPLNAASDAAINLTGDGGMPDSGASTASLQARASRRPPKSNLQGLALVELRVDQDGLYRVTYEALKGFGVDLTGVRTRDLALSSQGKPVPIFVNGTGSFGPGEHFEFVGSAIDTLYTRTNVYALTVDEGAAKRVAESRMNPIGTLPVPQYYMETLTVENDEQYSFSAPNGDPWFDEAVIAFGSPKAHVVDVPVDEYVPGAAPVRLDVSVWGGGDWPLSPDHHLKVRLNSIEVADEWFDGIDGHPIVADVPADIVHEGANELRIELPFDSGVRWDVVNLDSYGLTYPRAFVARDGVLEFTAQASSFRVDGLPTSDVVVYVDDGNDIERLKFVHVAPSAQGYAAVFAGGPQEATYHVYATKALLTPDLVPGRPQADITSGQAQYLMIAHPDFIGGLAPLVSHHEARGIQVRVVDVHDVYQQLGYGIFDPASIRAYITHAVENMRTEAVLLVGGDSYDYLDHLGQGSISFIPTPYTQSDTLIKFAPVDPLLADVDGDELPDVPIGRFPVRTSGELETMIAKTLLYDAKDYGHTAVFAADANSDAVSFAADSEAFAAQLPGTWAVERAYLDEVGLAEARARLLAQMNDGVAMTSFVGHSSMSGWTFRGLFKASDAATLTNAGRPTVVTQWGCWNTYHVSPSYNTLSHKFLMSGDRGASAVLGSATLTQSTSEHELGTRVTPRLVQPGMTMGRAIQDAKDDLALTSPELTDVLLGWTLLGDPMAVVTP